MTDPHPVSEPLVAVGPGERVRFAVFADDDRRSTDWAVWTSRHTRDAYLSVRRLSGTWKISLHRSGSWQIGFTDEFVTKSALPLANRHLDIWQMPRELTAGLRRSVEVVFPDSELRPWQVGATDRKPVYVVPAPGVGHAAIVEFLFMEPQPPLRLEFEAAFHVAVLGLCDGSMLRVVARQVWWLEEDEEWLLASKQDLLAKVDPDVRRTARDPRGFLYGTHPDGIRYVVELAGDLGPLGDDGNPEHQARSYTSSAPLMASSEAGTVHRPEGFHWGPLPRLPPSYS